MTLRFVPLIALVVLAGCSKGGPRVAAAAPLPSDWKRVATRADAARLHGWRSAFVAALSAARVSGHAAQITREGSLLAPDAALENVALPGGKYSCRVIKLGAKQSGLRDYTSYPPFECLIADEGRLASFTKTSGSQRPVGLVFDGDARRKIFLGTMMFADEQVALDYGRDADRDMAGAIERIGPQRWRMILPYPRFESTLDVIELVPAV